MRQEDQKPDPGRNGASLWDIDRLLAGDLDPEEKAAVEKSIAASPELSAYVARMRDEAPRRTFRDLQGRMGDAGLIPKRPERVEEVGPSRNPWKGWAHFDRMRWAIAALLALALGLAIHFLPTGEDANESLAYRNKGAAKAEIRIRTRDQESGAGGTLSGGAGDTVGFFYRSPAPLYVQVWVIEPGKPPQSASGEGQATLWDAASRWKSAPDRLILEGDLPYQEVAVAVAEVPFGTEAARQAVLMPPRNGTPIRILRFRIEKKP